MSVGGETVTLTVASARAYLDLYFKRAQRDPRKFSLTSPKAEHLAQSIDQRRIFTPWSTPLQGLRAGLFNDTQARLLTRDGSRVTWSQPLDQAVVGQLTEQFLEKLANDWRSLYQLCGDSLGDRKDLPEAECERLFVASFTDPVKPRLIPRIEWPTTSERTALIAEFLPAPPWKDGRFGGLEVFKKEGPLYIFEAFGDRGEVYANLSSENLDEIYGQIFNYVALFDHYDNDDNFIFNNFYSR